MSAFATWSTAAQAQLSGALVRAAVFFRMESDPLVRVWTGIGGFEVPADGVEPAAALYSGVGDLTSLPTVSQLINGVAERVTFTLSGVPAAALALAQADHKAVAGARCRLGFCVLDADLQRLSPVAWLWTGEADKVTPSRQADGADVVRSVSLSVGSLFTSRKRPTLDTFTDAQQRLRSPDDAFCSNVASISQGITKRFKPRD